MSLAQSEMFKTQSKDEAMAVLEVARKDYIERARTIARRIARNGDGTCNVDKIREILPPPEDVDGRVMGAIFNSSEWEHSGFLRSARKICHGRPISVFKLK